MGQNFYLKSPKEQRAPLEYQEESGIEYWLYSQRAIRPDASIWKTERRQYILLYHSSRSYLYDYKSKYAFTRSEETERKEINVTINPTQKGSFFWGHAFPSSL